MGESPTETIKSMNIMKIKSKDASHSLFAGFDPTTGQIHQDTARRAVVEAEE